MFVVRFGWTLIWLDSIAGSVDLYSVTPGQAMAGGVKQLSVALPWGRLAATQWSAGRQATSTHNTQIGKGNSALVLAC